MGNTLVTREENECVTAIGREREAPRDVCGDAEMCVVTCRYTHGHTQAERITTERKREESGKEKRQRAGEKEARKG